MLRSDSDRRFHAQKSLIRVAIVFIAISATAVQATSANAKLIDVQTYHDQYVVLGVSGRDGLVYSRHDPNRLDAKTYARERNLYDGYDSRWITTQRRQFVSSLVGASDPVQNWGTSVAVLLKLMTPIHTGYFRNGNSFKVERTKFRGTAEFPIKGRGVCGTLPNLTAVSNRFDWVATVIRGPSNPKNGCGESKATTEVFTGSMVFSSDYCSNNPEASYCIPGSPPPPRTSIAKIPGWASNASLQDRQLIYSVKNRVESMSIGGLPFVLARGSKKAQLYSQQSVSGSLMVSHYRPYKNLYSLRTATYLYPTTTAPSVPVKLAGRYDYRFCGDKLVRVDDQGPSTIEIVANPLNPASVGEIRELGRVNEPIEQFVCNKYILGFSTYNARSNNHKIYGALLEPRPY